MYNMFVYRNGRYNFTLHKSKGLEILLLKQLALNELKIFWKGKYLVCLSLLMYKDKSTEC